MSTKKYVPPNKRQIKNTGINMFKSNESNKSQAASPPPPPPSEDINMFPKLGNSNVVAEESKLNYAASAKSILPPVKKKKPKIEPGWVVISRENGKIKYRYGEKPDLDHRFIRYYFSRLKQLNAVEKILRRHEEYEEFDLEVNGPKYVGGWEISTMDNDDTDSEPNDEELYESSSESEHEHDYDYEYEFNEHLS